MLLCYNNALRKFTVLRWWPLPSRSGGTRRTARRSCGGTRAQEPRENPPGRSHKQKPGVLIGGRASAGVSQVAASIGGVRWGSSGVHWGPLKGTRGQGCERASERRGEEADGIRLECDSEFIRSALKRII